MQESFTILDRGDAEDLIAIVRHELGLDTTKRRFPTKATCLAIYSRVVNSEAALTAVLEHAYPWCAAWETELRKLFAAYVRAKQAQNVLDYDDLLLYWSCMVEEPALARAIGDRFDHVLVDEYQDTNRLQASILLALKPDGRGVTVVGDDAQSIYSFRAATVRNILDFPRQYTPPARVVTLERNYRSTQAILDASNAVIGLAPERFTKNLWTDRLSSAMPRLVDVRDEADQATYVAERVLEQREHGMALKSQAVLFRSSSHSAQLELELARRGIPFVKYGGLKFLEAAHVKDVLSVLRWADNPRNRLAGFRAARLVPGIGAATATRLLDAMSATPDVMPAMEAFEVPPPVATDWNAFLSVFRAVRGSAAEWPVELERVTRWYEPHLQCLYDDAPVRQRDLVQLQQIASTYSSRERFLTEMALDPPDATSAEAGAPGTRRRLPDPVDHSLGQGAGVEVGADPERGRRLHSLRHEHRDDRRGGGGAASPLCRDDAGQGRPAAAGAAALLRPPAGGGRGPSRLRVAQPVHSRRADSIVRMHGMARRCTRRRRAQGSDRSGRAGRYRCAHAPALAMRGGCWRNLPSAIWPIARDRAAAHPRLGRAGEAACLTGTTIVYTLRAAVCLGSREGGGKLSGAWRGVSRSRLGPRGRAIADARGSGRRWRSAFRDVGNEQPRAAPRCHLGAVRGRRNPTDFGVEGQRTPASDLCADRPLNRTATSISRRRVVVRS